MGEQRGLMGILGGSWGRGRAGPVECGAWALPPVTLGSNREWVHTSPMLHQGYT